MSPGGLAGLIAGISAPPCRVQELKIARRAMACEFSITISAAPPDAVDAACAALDEIDRLEAKLSAYRQDSELSLLNRTAAERPVPVDAEMFAFLALAKRLAAETWGAFDIAAGALTKAWGFFAGPKRVPAPAELASALAATGSGWLALDEDRRTVQFSKAGVALNPGGIGKGYAIDRVAAVLRRASIGPALIQGGGSSLCATGAPASEPRGWSIAVGDPLQPGRAVARVWLRTRAMGTSGDANEYFISGGRRYGHVLDPRTGWPAAKVASATAVAPTAAEADALSTAFYVLGIEGTQRYCREHPGIGAVLVTRPRPDSAVRVISLGDVQMDRNVR